MSAHPDCFACGAPREPATARCSFCGASSTPGTPSAGLERQGWEERLAHGRVTWGSPLAIDLPASVNDQIILRSHALLDDVTAAIDYRFEKGQGWAAGLTASCLSLSVRASSDAGYDVAVSVAGLVSISRYAQGKLEEWLLEPSCLAVVREGIGVDNRLVVTMVGDRLTASLNGRAVASVRDGARRAGAVEIHVRPGSAPARVVVSRLAVGAG